MGTEKPAAKIEQKRVKLRMHRKDSKHPSQQQTGPDLVTNPKKEEEGTNCPQEEAESRLSIVHPKPLADD